MPPTKWHLIVLYCSYELVSSCWTNRFLVAPACLQGVWNALCASVLRCRYLKTLMDQFNQVADVWIERLEMIADGKTSLNILDSLHGITLDVIGKVQIQAVVCFASCKLMTVIWLTQMVCFRLHSTWISMLAEISQVFSQEFWTRFLHGYLHPTLWPFVQG